MPIRHDSPVPVYRQLAALVRERIESGELRPGYPVPSEGQLMGEHGVSRDTVRRACDVLRGEGLIITVQGKGQLCHRAVAGMKRLAGCANRFAKPSLRIVDREMRAAQRWSQAIRERLTGAPTIWLCQMQALTAGSRGTVRARNPAGTRPPWRSRPGWFPAGPRLAFWPAS